MTFENRGITANIPDEMIDYARSIGIDIPTLLQTATNRMLRVSGTERADFAVAMQIHNPLCDPAECIFQIKVRRKDD